MKSTLDKEDKNHVEPIGGIVSVGALEVIHRETNHSLGIIIVFEYLEPYENIKGTEERDYSGKFAFIGNNSWGIEPEHFDFDNYTLIPSEDDTDKDIVNIDEVAKEDAKIINFG